MALRPIGQILEALVTEPLTQPTELITQPVSQPGDAEERNFRPRTLDDFVGQTRLKGTLRMMLHSAQKRKQTLEHVLFFGLPGLGKTTLAAIIAAEMGATLRELAAPALAKAGDLVSVLSVLRPRDVLFLDEIHRLRSEIAELLYSAMEDYRVSIVSKGDAEPITLPLHPFTLVGATTDYGLLPGPLRDRFGQTFPLELYTEDELSQVIARAAETAGLLVDADSLQLLAARARGTPRVALRLFRRVRDLAVVEEVDITGDLTERALGLLRVDALGLDEPDRRYLYVLLEHYGGGPVGPQSLAASTGFDPATITEVIEPLLLRRGLIIRTRKGRKLTPFGQAHVAAVVQ